MPLNVQNGQRRQVHRRITDCDRLADNARGQSYGGSLSIAHLKVEWLSFLLLSSEFLLSVAPLRFDARRRTICWSITTNNAQSIMATCYRSAWKLYVKRTTLHFHLAWLFTRKACPLRSIVRPWSARKVYAKDFTKGFASLAIAGHSHRAERRRELLQRARDVMEDCASEEIRQCFEETMRKVFNWYLWFCAVFLSRKIRAKGALVAHCSASNAPSA